MARELDPDKRRRLLEAAVSVFSREGYRHATVATIAREAGVAKGGLYSYFPSKEALFSEVILGGIEGDLEMLRGAVAAGGDAERTLRGLFGRWVDAQAEVGDLMTMFIDFWAECGRQQISADARDRASKIYAETRGLIADLLRSGIGQGKLRKGLDTRAIAQSIVAFWDGIFAARLIVGDSVDMKRTSTVFLRELLRGIRA
jgi:TetR/AcrR family transcriptional regulator, repressor for uid operon